MLGRPFRLDEAVFGYRKYLQMVPAAVKRAQIEALIVELETESDRRAEEARAAEEPSAEERSRADEESARINLILAAEPAPPRRRPIYRRWWFITGAVVVVSAVTGAAIMLANDDLPDSDLGVVDFRR